MTLVLSRRTASAVHALWRPSATVNAGKKRKRAEEWVCWRCRQNNTRNYSDDVPYRAGTTVGEYLFSPREERKQEQPVFARRKASLEWRGRHADAWGNGQVELGEDDGSRGSNAATAAAAEEKNGVAQLTAREPADTTLWEKFEAADGDSTEHIRTVRFAVPGDADAGDRAPATTVADPKLLDIDYATLFPDALQEANADLTARCLFAAATAKDHGFVGSMSNATFNEVLRLLEPGRHVDKLMTAHTELSEAMLRQLAIPSLQDVAYEYAQLMSDLVLMRRSAGQRLTYADYIVLLRSARDLGNPRLARSLWRQMALEEIQPDREAWNLYIATVIATRAHVAAGRHKHRITPYHRLARSAPRRGQAFAGYSVGPDGLKTRVMSHFREMLDQGVAADEETFRLVMTAAAREGDIDTVKSILKRVWDINVEALVAGEPESSILPKQLPPDSSLKPTSKLLFTIAHAFGINNDVPTALRLVDFVSRHYRLTLDNTIWAQLFEWTFVLSIPRTGSKAQTDGSRTGALPKAAVINLWETMTGEPYNIQPTMGMYNHLIKNLFHRDMHRAMIEKMTEGLKLRSRGLREARQAWIALTAGVNEVQAATATPAPAVLAKLQRLRSEWELADLQRKRDTFWCKRWVRLLLASTRSPSSIDTVHEMINVVPGVLGRWKKLAPSKVRYEVPGGLVEFELRTAEAIEGVAGRREEREAVIRKILGSVKRFMGEEWVRQAEAGQGDRGPQATADDSRSALAIDDLGDEVHEAEDDGLRREVKEAVDSALSQQ